MSKRVLSVVGTGYRATIEEQDDTTLWFTSMCSSAGLDLAVLLRGHAVNYAVRGKDTPGFALGDLAVEPPPALDHDLEELVAKGVAVHYVTEDLSELGVSESKLVGGLKAVGRADLPVLFSGYDQIWNW